MRRLQGLTIATLAVLSMAAGAGCRGSSEPLGPTATLPRAPTSPATPDPYAVPAVIDAAYVERVLAGIDQVIGDAIRLVVATRLADPAAVAGLSSVTAGTSRELELKNLGNVVAAGLAYARPNPSNQVTEVAELLEARPTCIFARVLRDYSGVTTQTSAVGRVMWVVLLPASLYDIPAGYNPTGWVMVYDGQDRDGSPPVDPCAGR